MKRFQVGFDLRLDRALRRDEVLGQLQDRVWEEPFPAGASTALAELFIAYRADRLREFGNARDQMAAPEAQRPQGVATP